ncbi:hypothetical protein A3K86_21900 [Photobacterium jeanii]|uniref:Fido domain-containing protein n=1 Tax=Photobacterium jeanii TaxID=858640 RepID=A0A178K452_9GAMM|nr:type II toxin-antitoxin system death-on-curing family toxin [Photobacterium jeanii]OAN11735.1 hypothetical protein A3K86_21900 [Photobacterium jeanii]PST91271.1 type II toxin-antitoxin system death-on-curing family toxin [Photobacterium jeanii]
MNTDTVVRIHEFLTEYYLNSPDPISPPGVKDIGLLDSAVIRKDMTGGGADLFQGVFMKAAALFHGIISNHSFFNGNKRTALLSALAYLGDNSYWVTKCTDEEMFEFTREVAAHEISDNRDNEIKIIAEWFKRHSRRREVKDQRMKLHELQERLSEFGFHVEDRCKNNLLDIFKGDKHVTSIRQKGVKGSEEYDVKYIKILRKKLKLTPDYGIDSFAFYGVKGSIGTLNKYMSIRHEVMRELAKI